MCGATNACLRVMVTLEALAQALTHPPEDGAVNVHARPVFDADIPLDPRPGLVHYFPVPFQLQIATRRHVESVSLGLDAT